MDRIHRQAVHAIFWLSLETDGSDQAVENIVEVSFLAKSAIQPRFDRTYFERIWVVQEISSERNLRLFVDTLSALAIPLLNSRISASLWLAMRTTIPG